MVTLGKSPVIMDAEGDEIPQDGRHWKVSAIHFSATASGKFIMLDKPGGRVIAESNPLSAGEVHEIAFDSQWFDGFYLQQNPGGAAYVYYQ